MATKNPRVPVMLHPEHYAVVKEFAARQGVSMSAVIAELVEMVIEPFQRVLELARAADEAGEAARQGIKRAAEAAEAELMPMAERCTATWDLFDDAARRALTGGGVGSAGARSDTDGTIQPPFSNTGVRSGESGGVADEKS